MSPERRNPSPISEVPGCLVGPLVEGAKRVSLFAGTIGLAYIITQCYAIMPENKESTSGGKGKSITTIVPIPPSVTVESVQFQSSQSSQNYCDLGEGLLGTTVTVIDERGRVITGRVSGAKNYYSIRGNKGVTAYCDKIKQLEVKEYEIAPLQPDVPKAEYPTAIPTTIPEVSRPEPVQPVQSSPDSNCHGFQEGQSGPFKTSDGNIGMGTVRRNLDGGVVIYFQGQDLTYNCSQVTPR